MLVISSDLDCGESTTYPRLVRTEIFTGPSKDALSPIASTMECHRTADDPTRIGELVLVPSHTGGDQVYVRVRGHIAQSATDTVELDGERIIHYLSHQSLTLPIDISRACLGVTCDPQTETCSKGMCVKKETNGCHGSCSDAASDVLVSSDTYVPPPDAGIDAPMDGTSVLDAPFDAPNVDGGTTCASLLPNVSAHWPFDEPSGTGKTTEVISGTSSTLNATAIGPGPKPCNDNLPMTTLQVPSQVLGSCQTSGCWQGGAISIGFHIKYNSGAGALVAHGSGSKAGDWLIAIGNNQSVNFTVYFQSNQGTLLQTGPLGTNATTVIAHADPMGMSLQLGASVPKTQAGPYPSLPSDNSYPVGLGGYPMSYVIDELTLSNK